MPTRYFRLDRFLSQQLQVSRSALRPLLAAGRVRVNGAVARTVSVVLVPSTGSNVVTSFSATEPVAI